MRALAVLLVLVHHGVVPLHFGGYVGVDVFFVMSGYLITTILLGEISRSGRLRLKRFYLRRTIRLFPPLVLMVLTLFVPALLLSGNVKDFFVNTAATLTYTVPFLDQIGHASGPWRHTWSLGIEEMFYLAWPAVLMFAVLAIRSPRLRVLTLLGLASFVLVAMIFIGPATLLRGAGLFLGCALALHLDGGRQRVPVAVGLVGFAGVLGAVLLGSAPEMMPWAIALSCGSATVLVGHLAAEPTSVLSRFFSWGPAAYLGLVSYEVYLWHYPLITLGAKWLGRSPIDVSVGAIALAVILAIVTHHALARPLERLKDALTD